jgi:selenocysteine lyase/cysteine desulfurase
LLDALGRGEVPSEALLDAVDDRTALVAISSVQFASGFRPRLAEMTERTKKTGARLFLDVTQHVGALCFYVGDLRPDYAVAHGYKWLLCPRGAAWLYVAPEHLAEIAPLVPSWRSAPEPHACMEGGPLEYASDARKFDASLALLPWVGAYAALETLLALDTGEVERRCLRLASDFREGAEERGFGLSPIEEPTQLVGVNAENAKAVVDRLARQHVMVGARGRYVRLGFHAFNNEADVGAALDALSNAL